MRRARLLREKAQPIVALLGGWIICALVFGWVAGTAAVLFAAFAFLSAQGWIEERIAARDPRVWFLYFHLAPAFVGKAVTSRGGQWHADKFGDGFSPEFKIEDYPNRLRVHQWRERKYFWSDHRRPFFAHDAVEIWNLQLTEFGDMVRLDWRLTAEAVGEGRRRSVSISLVLCRWEGSTNPTREVIFTVPLDGEMLERRRGTGQEHTKEGWTGQSAPGDPDWSWTVVREP